MPESVETESVLSERYKSYLEGTPAGQMDNFGIK